MLALYPLNYAREKPEEQSKEKTSSWYWKRCRNSQPHEVSGLFEKDFEGITIKIEN